MAQRNFEDISQREGRAEGSNNSANLANFPGQNVAGENFDDCLACLICGLPEAQHGEVLSRLNDPSLRQLVLSHRPCKPTYDVRAEYVPKAKLFRNFRAGRLFAEEDRSCSDAEMHQEVNMDYRMNRPLHVDTGTQSDQESERLAPLAPEVSPREKIKFCSSADVIGFDGGKENLVRDSSSTDSDDVDFKFQKRSLHDKIAANLSNGNIDGLELLLDPVTRSNTMFNANRHNFEAGIGAIESKSSEELNNIGDQVPAMEPIEESKVLLRHKPVPPPKPSKSTIESKLQKLHLEKSAVDKTECHSLRIKVGDRPSILDVISAQQRAREGSTGLSNSERKYKSSSCTLIRINDQGVGVPDNDDLEAKYAKIDRRRPLASSTGQSYNPVDMVDDTCYFRGRSKEREAQEQMAQLKSVVMPPTRTKSVPDYLTVEKDVHFSLFASDNSDTQSDSKSTSSTEKTARVMNIPVKMPETLKTPAVLRCTSDVGGNTLRPPLKSCEEQSVSVDVGLCRHIPRSSKPPSPNRVEDRHYRDYSPKGLVHRSISRSRLGNFKKLLGLKDKPSSSKTPPAYDSYRSSKFLTPPPPSLCSLSPSPLRKSKNSHLFHDENDCCHIDDDDVFITPTVVVKDLTELSRPPAWSTKNKDIIKKDLDGTQFWSKPETAEFQLSPTDKQDRQDRNDEPEVPDDPVKGPETPRAIQQAYLSISPKAASFDMSQSGLLTQSFHYDSLQDAPQIPLKEDPKTTDITVKKFPVRRSFSPSDSNCSWMSEATGSSGSLKDMTAMHNDTLQYILSHTPSYAEFWRKTLGLDKLAKTACWKDITILSDNPILALDYVLFYAGVLRAEKNESPAKIITAISPAGCDPGNLAPEYGLPSLVEFYEQIPQRYIHPIRTGGELSGTDSVVETRCLCRVSLLPRLLIVTLPMWGSNLGQLTHQPRSNQEHRMCFVLLQILEILRNLQFEGVEALPQDLSCFLVIASNHSLEKWPRLVFMRDCLETDCYISGREKHSQRVTLCRAGMLAIGCILRGFFGLQTENAQSCFNKDIERLLFGTTFSQIAQILNQEHSSSLAKAKSVLEVAFWLNETEFLSPTYPAPSTEALRSWLERERALKVSMLVKNIFGEKDFPDIHNDFHIVFLSTTSAQRLKEACLLLRSPSKKVTNVSL